MAYTPRLNKISFQVPVFDGGLNTKYTDTNTPINQSPDLQNVEFDDFGAVGTSKGYTVLNSTAIASAPIDGLHEYMDNSNNRRLIAACNGNFYDWGGSTFDIISGSTSIYTAAVNSVDFKTVDGECYIAAPYINMYRYDGTTLRRVGISSVTEGVGSAVSSAAGSLNGTYNWAITGVNSANVESDYSELLSASVAITSGTVILSGMPDYASSFNADIKYLYRNKAAASAVYYRVTALSAAQSSYTDTAADSALVTAAPDDNGVPPKVGLIMEHRNRVFGAGDPNYPERLYWSNQGSQQIWESTSYVDIGEGDGMPIRGLAIYANSLFIHKNDGKGLGVVWVLYMNDSLDVTGDANWYPSKLAISYGGMSHKAIVFYNNLQVFLNRYGVYAIAGDQLAKSPAYSSVGAFPVDALSFLIEPDIKDCNVNKLGDAAAINFDSKLWFALPKGSTATKNNRIYMYDYVRASSQDNVTGAWSVLDNPGAKCFTEYEGNLYCGSSNDDGYVYKLNTGYNQNNSAIDSYFNTIWIHGEKSHKELTKVWRHLYLWIETSGDWDLDVSYWVDFDQSTGTETTIDLASGGTLWDEGIFDSDVFGGGTNKKLAHIVLDDAVGRVIKFKFSTNAVDQRFKIYEMRLEYNLRRIR